MTHLKILSVTHYGPKHACFNLPLNRHVRKRATILAGQKVVPYD